MSANDGFNGGGGRPDDPQQPEQLGSTWGAVQWQDDQAATGSPADNPVVTPPESAANGNEGVSGQMPSLPDLGAFGAGFAAAGREDAAAAGENNAPVEPSQQSDLAEEGQQPEQPELQDKEAVHPEQSEHTDQQPLQAEQSDQPEPNVQFGDVPAQAQQQDAAAQPETHEQHNTPDEPEAAADPVVNFGSESDENATRAYDTQAFRSDAFASASEQQDADKSANDQPTEVFQRDEFSGEQVVGPHPNDAQAGGIHSGGHQTYGAQSYGAQTYGGAGQYNQPYSSQPENQDGPEFTQAAFTQQPYGETPQEQQPYNQQYGQQGDYQRAPYFAGGAPAPFQNAGPVPMHPGDEQEPHHSEPGDKKRRRRKSKSHQADAATATPAGGGKKKRRTGLIVTIAIIAVLAIAAAVLVPLYLHLQNQQRGDELAQEFNEKVKAYEQSWGEEALAAASGPEDFAKVAGGKRESIFVMSADQKKQFEAVCGDVQASKDARQKLVDTKAPELPKDEGARASEAYKKAEKKSADLSGKERAKVTEFLDESDKLLTSMESLCGNLGPYLDANQKLRDIGDKDLPKTITVENGGSIVSDDGTVEWKCTAPEGCRDLYHKDTRTKYADVIDSMYTDYYNTLADLFEKQCFADDFAQVCSESVEPFREAAKKSKAYTDYLRKTEPVAEVGKPMYPDEEKLLKEASGAQYAAEEALVNAWRAKDGDNPPASMGDTPASIEAYYQAKQEKVRELAAAVGDGK
ncbi:hypothetical protein PV375_04535 [Gulosibacter sp. GYB002]|uniref:hypothetical protein n=1 Tax=Gulosibacter sp. GYB002 TaxID=2994391 RepID=UPI002F96A59F